MASYVRLLLLSSLFGSLAAAAPMENRIFRRTSAADLVGQIMPGSLSCSSAQFADECRTNVQAAPYLIQAMQQYGLNTAGQIAAVLAVVGYESGDLAYKHNVSPGRPGQGTSNMQMATYNALYAASISALSSGVAAANGDVSAILSLVTADEYNFGSGPWFLTTQCSSDVVSELRTGTDAAFSAYMACIGVDATDSGRLAYWNRAKTAFGF
ncbi:hypothetical protein CMQ_3458 [Grosmannia clavigera kw1407]|uniref:Uncharacterized protein n=1 Tax=Grosmannia clavigera (strain kw1407 / UAMH 11150) TaxID=655863 RepID=F0X9A9_GROCL|nr:uncharacterized protein CMQ_3458 [Grosmannia clavigera kw1407]EFX05389.1 hypothetical protein CMQ_3458 [Grosmannia clavigera kw1407]